MVNNDTEPKLISLEELKSEVLVVTLGAPGSSSVSITNKFITDLRLTLAIARDLRPRGIIFTGVSESMFLVGADIDEIADISTREEALEAITFGQSTFSEIASLPFPSVCAISGPCAGGGYELALACKKRICSDSKDTKIGLPETKLGIIPGFGGCVRLAPLVGFKAALELILSGKLLRANEALKKGLVDEVVPYSRLISRAEELLLRDYKPRQISLSLLDKLATNNFLVRNFVAKKAKQRLASKFSQYPAPFKAVDVIKESLESGQTLGLKAEAQAVAELILTPESKSLVHVFRCVDYQKSIGKAVEGGDVQALVVGGGVMGRGITNAMIRNKIPVLLKEENPEVFKSAISYLRSSLEKSRMPNQEKRNIEDLIENIEKSTLPMSEVNLVIEAISEKMETKQGLFASLSEIIDPGALMASNTSSLSIDEISTALPNPQNLVGMHFFNPADKMPLLEIVRGQNSSINAVMYAVKIATMIGKIPVIAEDSPGFIVNRILAAYLSTACLLLEKGYTAAVIDKAALEFGLPMGPFRLLDEIGLDIADKVCREMIKAYGKRMEGPLYPGILAAKKSLGKKSGQGFYSYSGKPMLRTDLSSVLSLPKSQITQGTELVKDALLLSLLFEAALVYEEGIAGNPGREAAQQIDVALVSGIGFPPFRGGILYMADNMSLAELVKQADIIISGLGSKFEVPKILKNMAKNGSKFY